MEAPTAAERRSDAPDASDGRAKAPSFSFVGRRKSGLLSFFVCICVALLIAPLGTQGEDIDIWLKPHKISTSHGKWSQDFDPDTYDYNIEISHLHGTITFVIELETDKLKVGEYPRVQVDGGDVDPYGLITETIFLKMDSLQTNTKVAFINPATGAELTYTFTIDRSKAPPLVGISDAKFYDDQSNMLSIHPDIEYDIDRFAVYVADTTKQVTGKIDCGLGTLRIKDPQVSPEYKDWSNGAAYTLNRNLMAMKTTLEAECTVTQNGQTAARRFFFVVSADPDASDIPRPRIAIESNGLACNWDDKAKVFECPNDKSKLRLIAWNDPAYRLTLKSGNGQVGVRLPVGTPSREFDSSLGELYTLSVTAGDTKVDYKLKFSAGGAQKNPFVAAVGYTLAGSVAANAVVLTTVLGAANLLGFGAPLGASEILTSLAFLLQFTDFSDISKGNTLLSALTYSTKWVTLFWPFPDGETTPTTGRRLSADLEGAAGESEFVVLHSLNRAKGCLFVCALLLAALLIIHCVLLLKNHILDRGRTFPYRFRFGNWESRLLYFILFPSTVAATYIIAHEDSTWWWRLGCGLIIPAYFIWATVSFVMIYKHVLEGNVRWLVDHEDEEDTAAHNTAQNRKAELELELGGLEPDARSINLLNKKKGHFFGWGTTLSEGIGDVSKHLGGPLPGYWTDNVVDQLNTEPMDRSILGSWLPWKWTSTCADVSPVLINPDDGRAPAAAPTAPMGYTARVVNVVGARHPAYQCNTAQMRARGVEQLVGRHLGTWLELMFTPEVLCRLHYEIVENELREGDDQPFEIPLHVRNAQLQGPMTSGSLCFFFDGARCPYVRVVDSWVKLLFGILVGLVLAYPTLAVTPGAFCTIGLLSIATFVAILLTSPYSRALENWLQFGIYFSIAVSSFAFMALYYQTNEVDPALYTILTVTILMCLFLGAYSVLLTFIIFTAVTCPPVDEEPRTWSEASHRVEVSIGAADDGWLLNIEGFSKRPIKEAHICVVSREWDMDDSPDENERTIAGITCGKPSCFGVDGLERPPLPTEIQVVENVSEDALPKLQFSVDEFVDVASKGMARTHQDVLQGIVSNHENTLPHIRHLIAQDMPVPLLCLYAPNTLNEDGDITNPEEPKACKRPDIKNTHFYRHINFYDQSPPDVEKLASWFVQDASTAEMAQQLAVAVMQHVANRIHTDIVVVNVFGIKKIERTPEQIQRDRIQEQQAALEPDEEDIEVVVDQAARPRAIKTKTKGLCGIGTTRQRRIPTGYGGQEEDESEAEEEEDDEPDKEELAVARRMGLLPPEQAAAAAGGYPLMPIYATQGPMQQDMFGGGLPSTYATGNNTMIFNNTQSLAGSMPPQMAPYSLAQSAHHPQGPPGRFASVFTLPSYIWSPQNPVLQGQTVAQPLQTLQESEESPAAAAAAVPIVQPPAPQSIIASVTAAAVQNLTAGEAGEGQPGLAGDLPEDPLTAAQVQQLQPQEEEPQQPAPAAAAAEEAPAAAAAAAAGGGGGGQPGSCTRHPA
uniref:Uncharacterized protein n=1 Tax=Vitrella brassicaformis TaxID=1169539 RepID=A0A7S1KB61_9ALVE|mmetsp:Transcript_46259/g.115057  ORF Transcript_46259/g.115057 Transcript_46259/m.115057 type:complete len:1515 (+) Transcript_46259:191-4735(+)